MTLIPVALALFHRQKTDGELEVWTQVRTDDGPFHGLLEFPGGGIEEGETPLTAAVREVEEEVGLNIRPEDGHFMGKLSQTKKITRSKNIKTISSQRRLFSTRKGFILDIHRDEEM